MGKAQNLLASSKDTLNSVTNLPLDTIILIAIFVQIFRRAKRGFFSEPDDSRRIVVLAAASALVAYLAQVQFHFDTIVTSFFIFICFALISDFELERNEPVLLFSSQKLTVPMALAAGAVFVIGAGWQIGEIVVNAMVGLTSL